MSDTESTWKKLLKVATLPDVSFGVAVDADGHFAYAARLDSGAVVMQTDRYPTEGEAIEHCTHVAKAYQREMEAV